MTATLVWQLAMAPVAAASGHHYDPRPRIVRSKAEIFADPAPVLQGGSSIILYGPQRFDYQPGPARNAYAEFMLPTSSAIAGIVCLQNGSIDGTGRVTGAIIQLNGAVLSTARTFNPSTVSLDIPVSLSAANLLSVRIVGAPGSYLSVTILAKPIITTLLPPSAHAGDVINIIGDYFDDSGPSQNTVHFTKTGDGPTIAQVTAAAKTQLSVIVPNDAATGPITIQTAGGASISPINFTLLAPSPVITDFNPKRAPVGDPVTLTGTDLKAAAQNPTVTFAGANNTRLPALVSSASPNQVVATVPNGAVTGLIQLTNPAGMATTSSPFFVEATQDFQITVAPSTASAVQGSQVCYVVTLTSPQPDFTQLATLSVQGEPTSSTISFNPAQITAGAGSNFCLRVAANLTPSSYPLTISATAVIDGNQTTRTAQATVSVLPAGTTVLSGRVLNEDRESIPGATVSLDGQAATTDAAGGFLLSGVNAGNDRPVMVDGRTASVPNRTYPVIAEPANIVAGQVNTVPYDFILPKIDTQYEVVVLPNQDTVVTTPRVPNLSMTIPAGANLHNRDGSPVTRTSITPVRIDSTPAPLPPNITIPIVFTSQPGGAEPNSGVELPVTYPNLMGLGPGVQSQLYYFDHDTVQWKMYGTGHVSNDGKRIVPDINPNTNKPYGLPNFSWFGPGGVTTGCASQMCNPQTDDDDCVGGPSTSLHPVVYSSGTKLEISTDISFGGARGGLELTRIYSSDFGRTGVGGRFGLGTRDNYTIRLTGGFSANGAGRVEMPTEGSGRLFNYVGTENDGTLVFATTETIRQLGDVVRKLPNNTFEYRTARGEVYHFNASRQLIALVDRNGNTTTLTYTGSNLTQITDPVGRSITLDYYFDIVTRATDPFGRHWDYGYTGGVLTKVTDPLGKTTEYIYENIFQAQLKTVKDKRGNVIKEITYDSNGRVIQQKFADRSIETYEYTLSGTVVTGITITDPLGRKMSKRFSSAGYVIRMTDELGQSSTIERTLDTNLPVKITGPCGCPEELRIYDANGNIKERTDRLGHTTKYEYEPAFKNLTRVTDRLGQVTNYTYDTANGNLQSVINALNQATAFSHDQFGQLRSITDPLTHTMQLEYDQYGNVSAVIDARNKRWKMEYDIIGRLKAIEDPLLRRSELTYDNLDRIKTTKDPSGAMTTFDYDENGNLTGVTNADNKQWVYTYDKKNRLRTSVDPLTQTTRFDYDLADQLTRITSPSKRKVSYEYDMRGQRKMITDGLDGIIHLTYDNRGNLVALTDQRNHQMTFAYDELFRLSVQTDPLGRKTNFGYDFEGNVTSIVDRLNQSTIIDYDDLNRREHVTYRDATVDYAFDPAGRLTAITDTQGGAINFGYDEVNRLISEQTSQGLVSYTYNDAGQRETMTAGNSPVVNYAYDTAGRPRTVTQGGETFTYSYDPLSRLQSLQRPNGVTTSYQYDAANRLARMAHNGPLATIEDFQYSYNGDDEIEAITSFSSATLLTTPKTAAPADTANRIQQFGQANYDFDFEGRTITKTDGQGANTYNWDARGRLTSVALPGGQAVSYGYDALGRRKSRAAGGVTTSFLYDGLDVVRDEVSGGSMVEYLNGPGIDQKLRQTGAGGSLYFLTDRLGSTNALTSGLGSVVERTQYEAFGNNGGSGLTRYGFTGREHEALTALLFYRARWVDAQQGRFITEDPIGILGGLNLYHYTNNNPINFSDPQGLWRQPDYYSVNVNVTIPTPWTGEAVSWSVTASRDRDGNWYWSPWGVGVGWSPLPVSGSITANWLKGDCPPKSQRLSKFLSGPAYNVTGGYGIGVSRTWSPGNGYSTGIGLVSPQIGGSYNYSYRVTMAPPVPHTPNPDLTPDPLPTLRIFPPPFFPR